MIMRFVQRFNKALPSLKEEWQKNPPQSYSALLKSLIEAISSGDDYTSNEPDPKRIQVVNFGDYQGTLVAVIGARGYQPYQHWVVSIGYGSCSACDSLQGAVGYMEDGSPEDMDSLCRIALHIVQSLRGVTRNMDEDEPVLDQNPR